MERARQEEWEKAHAVETKKGPYNPFEGMKRQATILAQQAEKSSQPGGSSKPEKQTFSPAASLQRSAFKAVMKEREETMMEEKEEPEEADEDKSPPDPPKVE